MEIKELESQLETLKNSVTELENKITEMKRNEDKKIPDAKDIPQTYDFDDYERTSRLWHRGWFVDNKANKLNFAEMDKEGTKQGNLIFPTKEFAEVFQQKAQFIADCLLFKWFYDREYVPKWNGDCENWLVYYNTDNEIYEHFCYSTFDINAVYFSSEEIAEKCAEWLNSKYFGIYNIKA